MNTPPGRLNTPPAIAHETHRWQDRAACRDANPALFDAEENDRRTNPRIAHALAACAHCPVKATCLTDVMDYEGAARPANRHTVRGGTLPRERADAYRRGQAGIWTCQLCTACAEPGEPLCAACGQGVSAGQESYTSEICTEERAKI